MRLLFWLVVALTPAVQAPKPGPALPLNATVHAGWLVGCWQSIGDRTMVTRESWTRAGADMLVATTIRTAPGALVEYSFLRLEAAADGSARFVSQTAGERPVVFTMEPAAPARELRFVGEGRRVTYLQGQKGETLVVRSAVEGANPSEMPMKKTDCAGR